MAVKARFWVTKLEKQVVSGGSLNHVVTLSAVTRKTGDNIEWAAYTPSGTITMWIHAEAAAHFEQLLGKDVSITIEEIPDGQ